MNRELPLTPVPHLAQVPVPYLSRTWPRFLLACAAALVPVVAAAQAAKGKAPKAKPREAVVEASIDDLQKAMKAGRLTSKQITQQYLDRIQAVDKSGPK